MSRRISRDSAPGSHPLFTRARAHTHVHCPLAVLTLHSNFTCWFVSAHLGRCQRTPEASPLSESKKLLDPEGRRWSACVGRQHRSPGAGDPAPGAKVGRLSPKGSIGRYGLAKWSKEEG